MATDVWQTSALCDHIHLDDGESEAEWEDAAAAVLYEVFLFLEPSTTEGLHHQHHQTTEDVSAYHSQSYFSRCLHGDRGIRLLL